MYLNNSQFNKKQNKEFAGVLYHGSFADKVVPTYGLGDDKHDYGRGLYLTPDKELAKEWAIGPRRVDGWVHTFTLDTSELSILNFELLENNKALYWVTELLKHREPSKGSLNTALYQMYKNFLLQTYSQPTETYDVIVGWRADDSYFMIAEQLLSDGLAIPLLEEALTEGQLGIQFCLKTKKAFSCIQPVGVPERVPYDKYGALYMELDIRGRQAVRELINSESNIILLRDYSLGALYWESRGRR